jgi:ATPase subunit of ABC transporter with duplicated ATPase domains
MKVYNDFEKMNNKKYRIVTSDGKKFDDLSAGWKTSVLLDIILGYEGDIAPLIIDQPEDNLATNYINHGLINAIKKIKAKKQVILVSHNATIPMLGDAQNIILCQNKEKLYIRSSRLEGRLDGKNMVDYIAEITDGGKSSIKKRVKKYNLKKFRE